MSESNVGDIRLNKIGVQDFRRIEAIELDIEENIRQICFVGPNGSSKSSLMTILANALCQMIPGNKYASQSGPLSRTPLEGWNRTFSTGEIRPGKRSYIIRSHWKINSTPYEHVLSVRTDASEPVYSDLESDKGQAIPFDSGQVFRNSWLKNFNPYNDYLSDSVFLFRPADRYEKAVTTKIVE
ncbi:ATP-binding protein [Fimbriiglobus ruber]|uniref:ATP-binding protein n=1 Tax=Fimbriiglobus ruber TaxID=1908690 RepID=UPI00117A44DE|nr:ATP-binding protein [Fimbriiglobus ruber]